MALLVALFFLAVYFFTANQLFSFDAVTNAIAAERSDLIRWFHPNHLLYPFLGALWHKIERLFSYEGYAIYSLARFNSIMAAAGLGIFAHALSRWIPRGKAMIAAAFLGSTWAVWHFAVDGRAVGITIFFSSLILWRLIELTKKETGSIGDAVILWDLSSLYIFSHAIAIFHIVPVAWFLAKRSGKPALMLYVGNTLVTVAIVYVAVYATLGLPFTPDGFFSWALGYAGVAGTGNALNSPYWTQSLTEGVLGLWHGFCNAFLLPTKGEWQTMFVAHSVGGLFVIALLTAASRIKTADARDKILFWALTAWGLLVTLFLALWSPGQEGFRLHVIVPWTAALVIAFKDVKPVFQAGALLAALLFSLNLSGPIYAGANIKNNIGYQTLAEIDAQIKPGDTLLAGTGQSIPGYDVLRPYFFPNMGGGTLSGWLLLSGQNNFDALAADFGQKLKNGRTVYWTAELLEPALQERLERNFKLEPNAVSKLTSAFETKQAFMLSNGTGIYEIVKTNNEPQ